MSQANTGPAAVADPAARAAIEKVLRRDRRLVRSITAATVLLWLLAAVAMFLLLRTYFLAIVPRAERMLLEERAMREGDGKGDGLNRMNTTFAVVLAHGAAITVGVVGVLSLAMMATVALVFASRRATLRQINLSLIDISNQLRELQRSAGAPPTGPPPP